MAVLGGEGELGAFGVIVLGGVDELEAYRVMVLGGIGVGVIVVITYWSGGWESIGDW